MRALAVLGVTLLLALACSNPTPPPAPKPTSTPPPPPPSASCPQGCTICPVACAPCIKGNISVDKKEKIYHVPGGRYYNDTIISPAYGERYFCTEQEALANGWRRSKE